MTVQDPHVKAEGLINELIATVLTYSNANEETKPAAKVEFDGTRAAAYIEQQAKQIAELQRDLRTVQNAAKTIASAHGTELEHLRQNRTFDHKLRVEHESLLARDALMTDALETAEAKYTNLLAESATIKERTDRLESEKEAAETRVAELEGALEPFDGYLGYFDGPNWTDEPDEAPL